ncbi:MAG TPA: hypothetical protein VMU43_07210 [Candidatus Acidoferrum sp.]|nr:hypothetical protein [Candidatus Acidoferrum sp.]
MKKVLLSAGLAVALGAVLTVGSLASRAKAEGFGFGGYGHFRFVPGTLVVTRSVYEGTASTVTVGELLPPACVPETFTLPQIDGGNSKSISVTCGDAIVDGTYPTVFENDSSDGSFAVSAPIFLDDITTDGHWLQTLPVPSDQIVTSFESKSELALNLSTDGKSITFLGYVGGPGYVTGPNQLDVSNSNTPGVIDPSNPDVGQYYRAVAEVDSFGHIQITDGNAYSGDNGRAVIKGDGYYYMVGNDNNGNLSKTELTNTQVGVNLVNSTGAELLVPGQAPPVPPNIQKIGDFEIGQLPQYAGQVDKAGKDNNFRGVTIFNNTLYVSKGSGSNGIDTIYQVGQAGVLPTPANAPGGSLLNVPITIPSGFSTTLASSSTGVLFPFGMWFANANTLYVCDEGDGILETPVNGNVAGPEALQDGGLQKWTNVNGVWQLDYVLQNGLNIGVPYSVPNYPNALNPATDGCRNLTGRVNLDGTATIYVVTSTVSASGDQGADPNKLLRITDVLKATTLPSSNGRGFDLWGGRLEQFVTIKAARYGEVLRGVAFAPTPWGDYSHAEDGR